MRQTGKRWLPSRPSDVGDINVYLRREFDRLSNFLADLARDQSSGVSEADLESVQNSVEELRATVNSLTSVISGLGGANSRVFTTGISNITIPEGSALIAVDGEEVNGTVTVNGTLVCV